jgi:hypothetical protein
MSKVSSKQLAKLMSYTIDQFPNAAISSGLKKVLSRAGVRNIGSLRDVLDSGTRIPGVGEERQAKLWKNVLEFHGIGKSVINFPENSYSYLAGHSYCDGVSDGTANAEKKALTQTLRFKSLADLSLEKMKDKVLEAYDKKVDLVAFRALVEHDVPGLGIMKACWGLAFSPDNMNRMLRVWDPLLKEDVKGRAVIKVHDMPPRECNVTINFETLSGILVLSPPNDQGRSQSQKGTDTTE